jgi:hypothetical protein
MLRLLYSRPDPSKSSGSKPLATFRRRSRFAAFWFFCLIVSVIALSFCLGLMLGWSGAERTIVQSRRPANPSRTRAEMPPNAPDTISNNFVPVSLKSPRPLATKPDAMSAGDLVVYENGKEIFRLGPAKHASKAKDNSTQSAAKTKQRSTREQ